MSNPELENHVPPSDKVLAQKVCDLLNEAVRIDTDAMRLWSCQLVAVNKGIVDHPTIIVKNMPVKYCMSNLGLINGIVDRISGYRIAEKWSDTKDDQGRYTFLEYVVVSKEQEPIAARKVEYAKVVGAFKDGGTLIIQFKVEDKQTVFNCYICRSLDSRHIEKREKMYMDMDFTERVDYIIEKQILEKISKDIQR